MIASNANRERWAKSAGREPHPEDWAPQPAQERFLRLGCFEALYGGAAGGGKTDALLVWLLAGLGQEAGPSYQALLLRRTFPELEKTALPRARELFPRLGGEERNEGKEWRFPCGGVIRLEHCEHEKDVLRYTGAQFTRVAFDELTTFTEFQYLYLISRLRNVRGVFVGVRASSNPGGPGHEWVRARFKPWVSRLVDDPAESGEIRYYLRDNDVETQVPKGTAHALGRTFIPARLQDNPALFRADPGYESRLRALPRLERLRLLGGDWDAVPGHGDNWDREKCGVLHAIPGNESVIIRVRAWDFGGGDKKRSDPSAGVRLAFTTASRWVIEDVQHGRWDPGTLENKVLSTALADRLVDVRTVQCLPLDPGAAGKIAAASFLRLLAFCDVETIAPSGDKVTRFRPFASRQLLGFVDVVDNGTWDVRGLHAECEAFPTAGVHDDRVDVLSDAYAITMKRQHEPARTPEVALGSRFLGASKRQAGIYLPPSDDETPSRPVRRGFGG